MCKKFSGKLVGAFTSSSLQAGGRESTALTFLANTSHLGMIYVPLGLSNDLLYLNNELCGANVYGAGTVTELDGRRGPTNRELEIAECQVRLCFISREVILPE